MGALCKSPDPSHAQRKLCWAGEGLSVRICCLVSLKSHSYPYFQQWAALQLPPFLLRAPKTKPTEKWDPGRQLLLCSSAPLRHVQGTSGMRGLECLHLPNNFLFAMLASATWKPGSNPWAAAGVWAPASCVVEDSPGCREAVGYGRCLPLNLSPWHHYNGRNNLDLWQGEGTKCL